MNHLKITFKISNPETSEILIALLSEIGFEAFEEIETGLMAYIPENDFEEPVLLSALQPFHQKFSKEIIEKKNWNAAWEAGFEPVIVENFCTVKAPFHSFVSATPMEIIISPKMSFGTGHHATTQLMMELMQTEMEAQNLTQKSVLDFGCGTGILSILAGKLGAQKIIAVDHEEWAVENARENSKANQTAQIEVVKGSLEEVPDGPFDFILANINRNVLLQYMPAMANRLAAGGTIMMSGIVSEDAEMIITEATEKGLLLHQKKEQEQWAALCFKKL